MCVLQVLKVFGDDAAGQEGQQGEEEEEEGRQEL